MPSARPPQFSQQWDNCGNVKMKNDFVKEKEPEFNKNKNINVYFCVAYSRYFSTSIHRVNKKIKTQLIVLG